MSRKTFSLSFLICGKMVLSTLKQHKLQAFLTNLYFHPNNYKQKTLWISGLSKAEQVKSI